MEGIRRNNIETLKRYITDAWNLHGSYTAIHADGSLERTPWKSQVNPNRLVGIYDGRVSRQQLRDDLDFAGLPYV